MSILIVLTTFVGWVLSSLRKCFLTNFLKITVGVIGFTVFGWKVFNVTRVETIEVNTDEDVVYLRNGWTDFDGKITWSAFILELYHKICELKNNFFVKFQTNEVAHLVINKELMKTTLIAQIGADYCTDGMELQLRHCIGAKMQTRHDKGSAPCAIR